MNDFYFKIFESSPVASVIVDSNSEIRFANACAAKLFGFKIEKLVGSKVDQLIPRQHRLGHPQKVEEYFKSPQPRQMGRGRRLFGRKKDGTTFPVEVGLTPIATEGELLVMSSIIDLSMQFHAEEKFQLVVESAPNGILMINEQGTIILVNKKIEELFGFNRDQLLGLPIEKLVPSEFRQHHPKFVAAYMQNPEPRAMGIGRELFGQKNDGTLFPVEIGLQPIHGHDNQLQILASIVDITQRRLAEKASDEKSEELQEFAYRTSHDLKSPLTTISSMLEFIKEDIREGQTEEAINNIDKLRKIATNLSELVKSMLFLTKADLTESTEEAFDFEDFYQSFNLKFENDLKQKNYLVELRANHTKPLVIQPTKMTLVLENLLANSIKFSDKKKSKNQATIGTYSDADFFYIQIKDNGLGIPNERHEEVFSMFKRFHHHVNGHGIGLYMVKKFVTKMNGEITFESSPEGTTFYIKMPLA